ncbi:MAG: hypothetical protein ACQKBU_03985, partial [Verrucomicrobiales bacterium]
IQVADEPFSVPMQWVDDLGLSGTNNFVVRIEAVADQAPACYFDGIAAQLAILPEETIEFEVLASDDFGLKSYGFEWVGEQSPGSSEVSTRGSLTLEEGSPDLARATSPAAFCPKALDISPQRLVVRAYAEDYFPDRPRSYSQPIILYVLSQEEHAQMLKGRFDRAIRELEDLARRERNLYEENQRLERLEASDLRSPENEAKLDKQEAQERAQANAMKELAETVEQLLQDSARNETLDKETLRQMAETMQSLRELAEEDLPEVEQNLGQAGDPKNTDAKSEQDMKDAVATQKAALEKMKETLEKANQANERFEASTFASRFKKAAGEQHGIARAAVENTDVLGLRYQQLDPADQGKIEDVIGKQSSTASDVRWIKEDLGHFFTRTARPVFGEILAEMNDSNIEIGLENVRLLLSKNHSFKATKEATRWSKQLTEWAEKLEGESPEGGGGGDGGGNGGEEEDFEFMLRVMKMVQQEQDSRARTRALETLRRSYETSNSGPQ